MGKEYLRTIAAYMVGSTPEDVLFFDRFIGTLQWTQSGTGGDSTFERDTAIYFRDSEGANTTASLHMIARTTGITVGDTVVAQIKIPKREGQILELSGAFRFIINDELIPGVTFVFWVANGTNTCKFEIQMLKETGIWQYKNSAGSWVSFTTTMPIAQDTTWQMFKITVDVDKEEYHSVIFGSAKEDLSGIAPGKTGGTGENVNLKVGAVTSDTSPAEIHFDDIMVREVT